VAVNCCVCPFAIVAAVGVTAIDTKVAFVTVSVVDPTTLPLVALIVELPAFSAVARPPAVIVAVAGVPDAHTALFVRSCVELSLNVPVAVNCCVFPTRTEGVAGVTAIDVSAAAVTVNTAVFEVTPPCAAVMFVVPTPTPVASPVVAPIVPTVPVADAHAAVVVRSCVVPSEKCPVAVNCCVSPFAIEVNTAAVVVIVVVPLIDPDAALIVTGPPAFTPVARPVGLIVTSVASDELQVTEFVRFCVEVSLNVPVAVNCCVFPAGIEGFAGVTAIDTSVAFVTVSVVDPTTPPLVALIEELPAFSAVAKPPAVIVATVGVPEAQTALFVRS
jgi:hypothetical protein